MKFTIVTPVYNGEKYLAETIESVLSQAGDFEIEYIIRDGASTDNTLSVIKSYDEKLRTGAYPIKCKDATLSWHSERDAGMYDAINKGFECATGDICAYINSDDFYLPGAFALIARVFAAYPAVKWLKGSGFSVNESSRSPQKIPSYIYNQNWIARGLYGTVAPFIQQETVFWHADLWRQSGGIDKTLRLAGDYYLWMQFARYAPLWSVQADLSCFRTSATQLTHTMDGYRKEQQKILPHKGFLYYAVGIFFWIRRNTKKYPSFSALLYRMCFRNRNKNIIAMGPNNTLVVRTVDSCEIH